MDVLAMTICALQILLLCYMTESVHAQDATIANINVSAVAPNILARIGRTSGMRCTFSPSYPVDAEVYWRRDDGTRLTEGRSVVFDSRQIRPRISRNRDSYGLLIRRVMPRDTGLYFCGVQLNGVVKEAAVNFTVVVSDNERGKASIRSNRDQVQGEVGGMAGMSCSYRPRYPQNTQFYWRKEDGTRVATGTSVVYESDRIEARMRTLSPSYALFIRRLEPSDSGVYLCGFEQNGTVGEASVNLRVLVPPHILHDESSPSSLTARGGTDLVIQCIASGTPTPSITWTAVSHYSLLNYSGGASAIEIGHGPSLTLHNLRRSNVSYYRCLADNGISYAASKLFFVEVQDLPVVEIPSPSISAVTGSIALMNCDVISSRMGQSSWIFEGQPVTNSSTHTIVANYRSDDELRLTLTIRPLSNSDFGLYTCQATNSFGSASGTIDLVSRLGP